MKQTSTLITLLCGLLAGASACAPSDAGDVQDGRNDSFGGKADSIAEGSQAAAAVLALVNDLAVDEQELDLDAGLSTTAAHNIIEARPFLTLAELDAVPFIGPAALNALLAYAAANGYLGVLYDDTRASLPYECEGTPLSRNEIVELFAAGRDAFELGSGTFGRAPISWTKLDQACNEFTGCTAWSDGVIGGTNFEFTLTEDDVLSFNTRLDSKQAISGGDFLYEEYSNWRVRIVRTATDEVCMSAVDHTPSPNSQNGSSSFRIGKVIIPSPSPTSSDPAEPAPLTYETECTGATLSTTEMYTEWFAPSQTQTSIYPSAVEIASRSCHPVTGCAQWRVSSNWNNNMTGAFPLTRDLNVDSVGDVSVKTWLGDGTYTQLPVVDGEILEDLRFSGCNICGSDDFTAIGNFTSTCMGITYDYTRVGSSSGRERVMRVVHHR